MQLCSCAPAQSAPTIRPYFPSARGACPRVASLDAAIDRFDFRTLRRSEPIRLDSAGSSFLKFAKSQRSFRNIAKIIIYDDQEICYEIFFLLLLLLTFFSVSAAAYEEITLTMAMYVFCHFLEFPGISVAQA